MSAKISLKEINRLAIPAIIAGVVEPLISLTDIAIIGNVKENPVEALAAAGIVGSFLSAIIWVVAQLKSAISAVVSQHYGANRLNAIKTLIPQVLAFSLIVSLFIFGVTTAFADFIFRSYNAEGLILEYSRDYFHIRAIGYPLSLLTFSIFGVFRGMQNTLWAMKVSITGALINVVLDFALVFGVGDFIPAMHLKGAAYASVIAQAVMLMITLYYFFNNTPFNFRLSKKINPQFKPLLIMAGNLFVRALALNIAIYFANVYATGYGKNFIAAQSVLMNIWLFFSFFIDGYASAGNAISGRLLGAKDYRKLWRLSKDVSLYAIIVSLFLVVLCVAFYQDIGWIFTKENAVIVLFTSVFWIVIAMQPLNAVAFVFDGIFKGLGEAAYLRNTLIVATFLGFLPTLWIADYFGLKLHAIWMAFAVWMAIRAGALIIKFKRKYLNKELN